MNKLMLLRNCLIFTPSIFSLISCTTNDRKVSFNNNSIVSRGIGFEERDQGAFTVLSGSSGAISEVRLRNGKNSVTKKRSNEYVHGLRTYKKGNLKLRSEIAVANADNAVAHERLTSNKNTVHDISATAGGLGAHYSFEKVSLYANAMLKETENSENFHHKKNTELGAAVNAGPYVLLKGGVKNEDRKYSNGLRVKKSKPVAAIYTTYFPNKKIGAGMYGDDFYLSLKSDIKCKFQNKYKKIMVKDAGFATSIGEKNRWLAFKLKWSKGKSEKGNAESRACDFYKKGTISHKKWLQGHPVDASSLIN